MTTTIIDLVLDYVLFLEMSSDDILNPDVAVKKLEDLILQIGDMEPKVRSDLIEQALRTSQSNSSPFSQKEREALESFFQRLGDSY